MKINAHGLECQLQFSRPDSEGWMRTVVSCKAPSFEGGFTCAVEIEEWKEFVETLRILSSSVGHETEKCWNNMEGNIEFKLKLTKQGGLEGFYRFSSEKFSLGPVLSGSFEADQTFLASRLRSAEQVLQNAR